MQVDTDRIKKAMEVGELTREEMAELLDFNVDSLYKMLANGTTTVRRARKLDNIVESILAGSDR